MLRLYWRKMLRTAMRAVRTDWDGQEKETLRTAMRFNVKKIGQNDANR